MYDRPGSHKDVPVDSLTGALRPTHRHKHHEYASIVSERQVRDDQGSSRDILSPDVRSIQNVTPNIYKLYGTRYATRYVHRLDNNTVRGGIGGHF